MKVSIIIPVYNVEKYIARCLDSVINQTYQDLEIIVVNDGTLDNSMLIVEEYARNDNRFVIVNHSKNRGLMMTRKSGYSIAKGEYLTFVDSDDCLPPDAIEVLLAKACSSKADIVAGTINFVLKNNKSEKLQCSLPFGKDKIGVYKALLSHKCTHNLCGKLFKSSLFQDFAYKSYEDMTNAEDACLFYQLVDNIAFAEYISDNVYDYMENSSSSTHGKYSIQKIKNVVIANKVRLEICTKYQELELCVDRFVTSICCNLYHYGHSQREIDILLKESGMEKYGSMIHAFSVLSFRELLVLFKNKIQTIV